MYSTFQQNIHKELLSYAFTPQEINNKQYSYKRYLFIINKSPSPLLSFADIIKFSVPFNVENIITYTIIRYDTLLYHLKEYHIAIINDFFNQKTYFSFTASSWSKSINNNDIVDSFVINNGNYSLHLLILNQQKSFVLASYLEINNLFLSLTTRKLYDIVNNVPQLHYVKKLLILLHKNPLLMSKSNQQFILQYLPNINNVFKPLYKVNDLQIGAKYIINVALRYKWNLYQQNCDTTKLRYSGVHNKYERFCMTCIGNQLLNPIKYEDFYIINHKQIKLLYKKTNVILEMPSAFLVSTALGDITIHYHQCRELDNSTDINIKNVINKCYEAKEIIKTKVQTLCRLSHVSQTTIMQRLSEE